MKIQRYLLSLSLVAGLLLALPLQEKATAQAYVDPTIMPSGRLVDLAPSFYSLDQDRLRVEVSTQQQYWSLAKNPGTYRLALAGSPTAMESEHGKFSLHGEVYNYTHGFQHNLHFSLGATSQLHIAPQNNLYATLHYDFGYKFYQFKDVITENPDWADLASQKSYVHTPTAALGWEYAQEVYRVGVVLNGSVMLGHGDGVGYNPERDYSLGGTAYLHYAFNERTMRDGRAFGNIQTYFSCAYYSMQNTGFACQFGLRGRVSYLRLNGFFRHVGDMNYLGIGAGIDCGDKCTLFYNVSFPFQSSRTGRLAGVTTHDLGFRFLLPDKFKKFDIQSDDEGPIL